MNLIISISIKHKYLQVFADSKYVGESGLSRWRNCGIVKYLKLWKKMSINTTWEQPDQQKMKISQLTKPGTRQQIMQSMQKESYRELYTVGMTHDILAALLNPHVYQTNYQVQSPNNYRTKTTAVQVSVSTDN